MDENYAQEYHDVKNEALLRLNSYFYGHIKEISDAYRKSLEEACRNIEMLQKEGYQAVEYLEFTMLRTRLIHKDYRIPIMAYGSGWYADKNQIQVGELDGRFIYSFYDSMIETAGKLVKKYQTKLPKHCLQENMCQAAEQFWDYVVLACQWAVMGFSPEGIEISETFRIRVCEYMGYGSVCWRYTPKMTKEQLKKWFGKRYEDAYKYRDFRGMDFTGWSFAGLDLTGSDFRNCQLKNCSFEKTNLTGTWFCNSDMEGAAFDTAWMPGARFDGANLKNAVFEEAYSACEINNEVWLRADNIAASFVGADLRGADFTFTSIDCADFTDALMEGVLFNDTHEDYYILNELQRSQVQFGFLDEEE